MIIVTIADARMFAKLLPINIDERRISGLCSNFRALFAPFAPLDKLRNLTLLDAIIPVSDPDEKAEKIITIHDLTFLKFPKYSTEIVKSYTGRIERCLKWTNAVMTFSKNTKQDILHKNECN